MRGAESLLGDLSRIGGDNFRVGSPGICVLEVLVVNFCWANFRHSLQHEAELRFRMANFEPMMNTLGSCSYDR